MSDPGAGPSHTNPTSGCNGAPGSSDAGSSELPSQPARTPASNIKRSKNELPRDGKTGMRKITANVKIRAALKKYEINRAKASQYRKAVQELRQSDYIEKKIKRIKHRTHLLERDIDVLNNYLKKHTEIGKNYVSRFAEDSKKLKHIINRIECFKLKKSQKETEIRTEIAEMLKIESETKVAVDDSVAAMKEQFLNKEMEINASIKELKDREANTKIGIENDIKKLQAMLAKVEREFDNNTKAMKKSEHEKKIELVFKINKIKQNNADLKRDTENKVRDMQNLLTTNENKFYTYQKVMQKYAAAKIGDINYKIKEIEHNGVKLKADTENNINRKQTELAAKEKEYQIFAEAMLKHEIEKMSEINHKIKEIEYNETKLKSDIESKIKRKQVELAAKEKENEIVTEAMLKNEVEQISEIKHKIRQIECDQAKLRIDIENHIKNKQNELATKEKQLVREKQNKKGKSPGDHKSQARNHDHRTSGTPSKSPSRTPNRNFSGQFNQSTPRNELQQKSPSNFFVRIKEEVMDVEEETMNISIAWDERTGSVHGSTPTPRYSPSRMLQSPDSSFHARLKQQPSPDDETMDISIKPYVVL